MPFNFSDHVLHYLDSSSSSTFHTPPTPFRLPQPDTSAPPMPCTTTSTATTFSTTSTLSTTAPHPRATSYRTTSPSSHRRYPSHRPQRRRGSRHEHDCTMTTCGCRLCITMSHLHTISKPLPPEKRQACILTISVFALLFGFFSIVYSQARYHTFHAFAHSPQPF